MDTMSNERGTDLLGCSMAFTTLLLKYYIIEFDALPIVVGFVVFLGVLLSFESIEVLPVRLPLTSVQLVAYFHHYLFQ